MRYRSSEALSGKVVAAERRNESLRARSRRHARPARGGRELLCFHERGQQRKREVRMMRLDRLIEPVGKFAMMRQSAMPFVAVVGDAAKLPLRQLKLDHGQRRIRPGSGADEAFDP